MVLVVAFKQKQNKGENMNKRELYKSLQNEFQTKENLIVFVESCLERIYPEYKDHAKEKFNWIIETSDEYGICSFECFDREVQEDIDKMKRIKSE